MLSKNCEGNKGVWNICCGFMIKGLKLFALSRIFYVASILPIRITMVRKIEKVMGKFLWNSSGKVLRVAMGEMKNTVEKGGLGVTCILSMSRSLMLSQLFRLLKSGDEKSLSCGFLDRRVDWGLGAGV